MSAPALKSMRPEDNSDREPFAAFIADDETIESLKPIVSDWGWDTDRIHGGGIANAVRSLALTSPPEILIVDLSESEEPRSDITALAEVCEPGTIVIALGNVNDVALYRDLVAAGIFDYLVKPVTGEQLRAAIATADELDQTATSAAPASKTTGNLITVVGVRGGVGASTIAINSAWTLAEEFGQKVALVDLDLHFGTAALAFDLEPGRGLFDALENPGRVDGLFIERALVKKSDNFSILSGEAPLGDPLVPNPTALNHLLDELKTNFRTVILDLPRNQIGQQQFVLSESKRNIFVADLSLTSIRDTIRMLAFAKEVAPDVPCTVVANRVAGGNKDEITAKDFENAIERKIDRIIPNDRKTAILAAKSGKTFQQISKTSKVAKGFSELSADLLDGAGSEKKASFWQRLKTGS